MLPIGSDDPIRLDAQAVEKRFAPEAGVVKFERSRVESPACVTGYVDHGT